MYPDRGCVLQKYIYSLDWRACGGCDVIPSYRYKRDEVKVF